MATTYACRQTLIKQNPAKPTTPRKSRRQNPDPPGPSHYESPEIIGGKGYCKIKRAPAYSFGNRCPILTGRPPTKPNAPVFNIRSMVRKGGPHKIVNGLISKRLEAKSTAIGPGPAAYQSVKVEKVTYKKPPAYTMQRAAKPEYQSSDMWTPSPNMYLPPIPGKRAPAYSFSIKKPDGTNAGAPPGPGNYDPKFEIVRRKMQAYSFGRSTSPRCSSLQKTPAPNTYCPTKFMYPLRKVPAPSFGIRHSPYLGREIAWLRSSETDLLATED